MWFMALSVLESVQNRVMRLTSFWKTVITPCVAVLLP
jgi:hypothetical protein